MKKWQSKCRGRIISHGQVGARIGQPGTAKQKSYCARSLGIAEKFPSARLPCSANYLSRRKWRCHLDKIEK